MHKHFKHLIYAGIFSLLVCLSSCDKNRVFEENKKIPDSVWNVNNKVSFNVPIKDTINPHQVFINVRNAGEYPFSNLFLFITTKFPNGKLAKDTVECILADERGKWLGNGSGDIFDNRILFKKGVRFPMLGEYTFTFEQAMRTENLPFIMDVGLRIEKQ